MTARSHNQGERSAAPSTGGGGGSLRPVDAQNGPADAISDEQLLVLIGADRDRAAFKMLFARYAGKIRAFLIRGGAAPDEADEATQETMMNVWRRADSFDPDRASAAAWLFTIARNRRIDLVRRGARPQPDPEDPLYRPDPPQPADAALADQRRDSVVRAAIGMLNEDQLEVVRLSFFDGLAHGDIAERLSLPLGTVKSRLRLAFQKLRSHLGEAFADELKEK